MRVKRLELENFRGVGKLQLELDPKMTVLVGKNGAGKTTIIEGIFGLLNELTKRVINVGTPSELVTRDVKNGQSISKLSLTTIRSSDSGAAFEVTIVLRRNDHQFLSPGPFTSQLVKQGTDAMPYELPLMAFYPVSRSEFSVNLMPPGAEQAENPEEIEVQGQANFRTFFEWYRIREDLENETRLSSPEKIGYRDPQLEAVRRAFLQILPEFTDLRVRRNPLRMELKKGDETLLIDQLSLGEKSLLAMIGDLARRLAILNPDLPNPLEGPGIILIDELDLHLHPHWQRNIIRHLRTVFPNCQFIVSTHSPQIVGEVEPSCLRILSKDADGNFTVTIPEVSKGLDSAEVLQIVMDTPEREEEVSRNLRRIFDHIDGERFEEARSSISVLKSALGGSIPEIVRAETMIALLEP